MLSEPKEVTEKVQTESIESQHELSTSDFAFGFDTGEFLSLKLFYVWTINSDFNFNLLFV